VAGPDGKSVRVFEARIEGREDLPEFYHTGSGTTIFVDSLTGGGWNFQGCSVSGASAGQCLRPVPAIKDYWFDWHLYHPQTTVK
jgi:hypothetical protein